MNKPKDLKIKLIVTVIYIGILVVRWITKFPCFFPLLFGIPCPLCGMTRATVSALSFDFPTAFSYNMMFWSSPILYLLFLFDGKIFNNNRINTVIWSVLISGFLVNWVFQIIKIL